MSQINPARDLDIRDTKNGGVDIVFHLEQGDIPRLEFVQIVAFYAGMIQTGIDAARSYAEQELSNKENADVSA